MDTPLLCSTASMVSGSVALEEAVEKAVSNGVAMLRKCFTGFAFPINLTISGRVTTV